MTRINETQHRTQFIGILAVHLICAKLIKKGWMPYAFGNVGEIDICITKPGIRRFIQLKSAVLNKTSHVGNYPWKEQPAYIFSSGSSCPKTFKEKYNNCDYLILACINDKLNLKECYIFPNKNIPDIKSLLHILSTKKSKYFSFLNKWNLIK